MTSFSEDTGEAKNKAAEGTQSGKGDKKSIPLSHAAQARILQSLGVAMERAPWSVCRRTGSLLGLTVFYGLRRKRDLAANNVQLAFPNLSRAEAQGIARRSLQNFGMTFCEFMHLRTASPREISDYAEIQGMEHIEQAFKGGKGILLSTAHFGNWEVMGARATQEFPMTVVVRLTSNGALQEYVRRVRAAVNIKMILKQEPGRSSLKVLRANEALAIFPDQYAGDDAPLLPMFGYPTRVVTALARLAAVSGAPIIPGYGVRRAPYLADGRVSIHVSPPLYLGKVDGDEREEAVMEGTRFVIRETENIVRQYPDQWLWMHRRWRAKDWEQSSESPPA